VSRTHLKTLIPMIHSKIAEFKARSAQDWLKPIQADRNAEIGDFGVNPEGSGQNPQSLCCFVVGVAFGHAFLLAPRYCGFWTLSWA